MSSSNAFPPRFDPADLTGPRAGHYEARADAFQQLVGDGLRAHFGDWVTVAPTLGNDGSIDAFVDNRTTASLFGLPLPLVVECKDHDDRRPGFWENTLTGWRRVQEKLALQAELGWPDDFASWRGAAGYLYCISCVLPSERARANLTARISDFFASLPADRRPPVRAVLVVDWAMLRNWLDGLARVRDDWLGVGLPRVQAHAEYLASLVGFRRYLLEAELPFVAPDAQDKTHPERLLERLKERQGSGGLLLVGSGGVGKTRTALEVAESAAAEGWRVLHARPGEPPVEVDDLAAALLPHPGPALLVMDYIDQMPGVDFGTLRHRLLPEAARRGVTLALLANARPGLLRDPNPELLALFEPLHLRPAEAQRHRITEFLVRRVAPTAIARLGQARAVELCGERPIIALLVAHELERRARGGTLSPDSLTGVRRGDLLAWLRRRLDEDGLRVAGRPAGQLLAPDPDPQLVAAAAVLAAAPLPREQLARAAEAALRPPATAGAAPGARIVAAIEDLGWLEPRADQLFAAHDVVADEVLERVLREGESRLREAVLRAVLAPALTQARVFGRYAITLGRLLGEEGAAPGFADRLAECAGAWLATEAVGLGATLAAAPSDEGAFALGAVITDRPWQASCLTLWSDLIEPWLNRHGLDRDARHLLYRGLRGLPDGEVGRLGAHAAGWLRVFGAEAVASFVLGPLLGRADLDAGQAEPAVGAALAWLRLHGGLPEADFVLDPLLGRGDLGERSRESYERAFEWLAGQGRAPEAQFVLAALLGRGDLGPREGEACERALEWLADHGCTPEASFVLPPLLGRGDLGDRGGEACDRAFEWLTDHGGAPEAQFVLHPLLERADLGKRAGEVRDRAFEWLAEHGRTPEAGFVLPPLLGRSDLGDRGGAACDRAFEWLAGNGRAPDAQFVLHRLLGREDLGERGGDACAAALDWLAVHQQSLDAGFVLPPLLRRQPEPVVFRAAAELAIEWLKRYPDTRDAEFVLRHLLGRLGLGDTQHSAVIHVAVSRLEGLPDTEETSFLLRWCLQERDLAPALESRLMARAGRWLAANRENPTADFVFNRVLRRRTANDAVWLAAAELALAHLQRSGPRERGGIIVSLLNRPELLGAIQIDSLIRAALAWLDRDRPDPRIAKHFWANLIRASAGTRHAEAITERARRHGVVTEGLTPGCAPTREDRKLADLLTGLATDTALPEPDPAVIRRALDRVGHFLGCETPGRAGYFIAPLLPLADRLTDTDLANEVTEAALRVLGHPRLDARARWGLAGAVYRLLADGAWADPGQAARDLAALGLRRPGPGGARPR